MGSFKRKDITFIFIFICFWLYCFSFLLYSYRQKVYYELSNELYTNYHTVLKDGNDTKGLTVPLFKSSYRIFFEYNNTYRFITQNNGDWSPPMLSGDFLLGEVKGDKAVIGKEMLKYVNEEGGTKYVQFQGIKYEVTGVMGATFASPTDYLILLYGQNVAPITADMRIVLDSDSKSTVTEITHGILNNNPSVTLIESTQKGLYRTANMPYFYYLLLLELFLILFLGIFAFLRYWYEKEKPVMYVLYLLGIPRMTVNKNIFIKVSLNILISTFVSSIILILTNGDYIFILKQVIRITILFLSFSWIVMSMFVCRNPFYTRNEVVKNVDK